MTRTLVLDRGYQPHRIVDWRRAAMMIFDGKAEVVEEYDDDIYRRGTLVIKMPAVVRLLKALRGKKRVKFSRINVATRDKFKCQYCGKRKALKNLTYDHVVPRSQGGKTNWENIVMACKPCNFRKANRTPREAGMELLTDPVRPKTLPIVAFHMDSFENLPSMWYNWVYWHGELDSEPNEGKTVR